jgi:hypothetical protein
MKLVEYIRHIFRKIIVDTGLITKPHGNISYYIIPVLHVYNYTLR